MSQGPGITWASISDLTTNEKYVQFTFFEETVLCGLIISTHKNFSLKSFRIRANSNPGSPFDLETMPVLLQEQVINKYIVHIRCILILI